MLLVPCSTVAIEPGRWFSLAFLMSILAACKI